MARSHKPIIWGLFAAGGTLAAFLVPVLILATSLGFPLGLLSADALAYEHVRHLLQHPLARLLTFGALFLIVWHAAHRMRITAHDLGIRRDTLVATICYGIAVAGTSLLLAALMRI